MPKWKVTQNACGQPQNFAVSFAVGTRQLHAKASMEKVHVTAACFVSLQMVIMHIFRRKYARRNEMNEFQ